ncbi:MAG TPA: hypothetical protein VGW39_14925 [Chthoniobacterales bacterium]|nr:hypothetical protein [Chthoniobacterales bacterium]
MNKMYLKELGFGGRINVDVYAPRGSDVRDAKDSNPAVVVVCGGGGKDARTGKETLIGKHAAAYHDLGESLSDAGFWAIIPSRRGDPQRTQALHQNLSPQFGRLPQVLFVDEGPNEGPHSHKSHVVELTYLVENLASIFGPGLDVTRVGLLGKSAGGGVALATAATVGNRISSVALWGSALRTSQWFTGPKADSFFYEVLDSRGVSYDKEAFLDGMCDAIDYVAQIEVATLFACAAFDPYAPTPPEFDKWSSASEQLELMRYAIHSRYSKTVTVKGAEHTMYKEHLAWRPYIKTLTEWFSETLSLESRQGGKQ